MADQPDPPHRQDLLGEQAEQELASDRLAQLAELTADAVFHLQLHPAERIVHLSRHLEELTGRSRAELEQGREVFLSHVHPEDRGALSGLDDPGDATVVTTPAYRLVHLDGRVTWVETSARPERDATGRVTGLLGVTRDVTASHQREEALRDALLQERAAAEELRRVNGLKDALLSAVSHELRTPLTVLQGFAELLLTLGDQLTASNRDAAVVAMERNARRLDNLLSSILDLDRLGRSADVLSRRDLLVAEVLDDVVEGMQVTGHDLLIEVGETRVAADRGKLERILENLVANAINHGGDRGPVSITAWGEGDGVVIEVADRGPGVPEALHEAVFHPFERGDAEAGTPGTGLGLALVAGFVELHGGRVWVEDRAGGGAAFRVWLPSPGAAVAATRATTG